MFAPFAFFQEDAVSVLAATYGVIFISRNVTNNARLGVSNDEFGTFFSATQSGFSGFNGRNTQIAYSPTLNRVVYPRDASTQGNRLSYSTDDTLTTYATASDPLNNVVPSTTNARRYSCIWAGGSFSRFISGGLNNLIQSTDGITWTTLVNSSAIIRHHPQNDSYAGGMSFLPEKNAVLINYGDNTANTSNITILTLTATGSATFSQASHTSSTIQNAIYLSVPGYYYAHSATIGTGPMIRNFTSTDGVTFTDRGTSSIAKGNLVIRSCYSPDLDIIVWYRQSGPSQTQPFAYATASLGPTFSIETTPSRNVFDCDALTNGDYRPTGMTWAKEIGKFICGDVNGARFYSSKNGKTWTLHTTGAFASTYTYFVGGKKLS